MRATEYIIDSWLDGATSGRPHRETGRRLVADIVDGRPILHAGTWRRETSGTTDLAEYLPAGRRRSRPLFLVTGDEWRAPAFHSSVQVIVRMAIQRYARNVGADCIVVPFSALAGAGIDRTSIRPLDIRPDRTVETLEPIPDEYRLDELGTAHNVAPWNSHGASGRRYSWRLADGRLLVRDETLERSGTEYGPAPEYVRRQVSETFEPGANVSAPSVWRAGNQVWRQGMRLDEPTGRYVIVHSRHFLGDCLFTAETVGRRNRRREWTALDVIRSARRLCELERDELNLTSSGRRRRPDEIAAGRDSVAPASARLGELDISAPIVETVPVRRRSRYLSSFDANEPGAGLYFLATLPGSSRARTVDMALDDLAPAPVHAAMARGRDVRRQGDIFAIATSLRDEDMQGWPRARLTLHTGHAGYRVDPKRDEPGYVAPLTSAERALLVKRARRAWRLAFRALEVPGPSTGAGARGRYRALRDEWLGELESARYRARRSILRYGETGPDYALGYGTPSATRARVESIRARGPVDSAGYSSVAHSRDAYRLAADRGHWLESRGRALETWRQVCRDELERMRPALRGPAQVAAGRTVASILSVHGTAHSASEVARGPGGAVYVRGIMRHVPTLEPGRRGGRDHINVKLGDGRTWYLAVRNTVPRNRDTAGS